MMLDSQPVYDGKTASQYIFDSGYALLTYSISNDERYFRFRDKEYRVQFEQAAPYMTEFMGLACIQMGVLDQLLGDEA